MTSQVIFNIDTKLKNLAVKRAKKEGIPLSAVLKTSLRAFVEGKVEFGLVEKFNEKTRREIEEALDDIKKGKNLSPSFSTIAEMKKYLDN
jgi:antitoxin component of RelBE/YafQ-DinJ toxin-antitoxin module